MEALEPRKRRAAAKPSIKDFSDSEPEEDAPKVPRKRTRKNSSDGEYCQPREEPAKRPRARAPPAKPRAAAAEKQAKPRVPRAKASASDGTVKRKPATARKKDSSGEESLSRLTENFSDISNHPNHRVAERNSNENEEGSTSVHSEKAFPEPVPGLSTNIQMQWRESDLLAENEGLAGWVASNLVRLFEEDNTIPFIARYRKEMTGNMEPEQLRHAKETFEEIKHIQHRASTIIKNIEKLGQLNSNLRRSILCAKSINELDLINTPFKTGSKKTLAERARQLGLEDAAQIILDGSCQLSLEQFVDKSKEGLSDVKEVQLGIQHIIADIISKDRGVLDFITDLKKNLNIRLVSKRGKCTAVKEATKASSKKSSSTKPLTVAVKQKLQAKADEESKYQNYFDFSMNVKYIKPHQILAINRGENQKELSVKLLVPDFVQDRLVSYCLRTWLSKGIQYPLRSLLLTDSAKDSYTRLILPLIVRQVRSELNQNAERASIEVFAMNLKKLLLMPPYRGRAVLGIDPGFRNGCKVALIGLAGEVLEYGVFYLNCGRTSDLRTDSDALWLRDILTQHRCDVIALGNGTACRETEEYLGELIQNGFFRPLDVSYTIVSEQGASIYSCSDEAIIEFPDMGPNIISAVSIARRLQDPLSEFVKVEPKHLGVGMYQHDLPEKKLSGTLDEIVVECVSFVGVDVNTAPHCLLRRVAGFNSSRAEKVVDHRQKYGPFVTRDDLKKVKGIGQKSYEQCAGFIRINPETVEGRVKSKNFNPLDRTWIHPESYSFAERFLGYCKVKVDDIGTANSIHAVTRAIAHAGGIGSIAVILNEKESVVKLVAEGLQVPTNHDFRSEFEKPLFRKGLTNINELHSGDILTGRILNTTHFGAFVDIGVGQNGLIHNSAMGGKNPQFGDRVQVKVLNVELGRQRIGLQLLSVL